MSLALVAFLTLGFGEVVVILIVGVLIFGKDLPRVGKQFGKTLVELRKGMQNLKDQIDRDDSVRELREATHDLRQTLQAPAMLAEPRAVFEHLTNEALASPGPETTETPPAPEKSLFEQAHEQDQGPASAPDRQPDSPGPAPAAPEPSPERPG
jgi:Sec-independent protein translocase protein TatA